MADEFTINFNGSVSNGNHAEPFGTTGGSRSYDQTGVGLYASVVTVGQAAEEDLATGDITTEGWLYLKNLSDDDYVTYGPKSGGVMVAAGRLEPGDEHWLRMEPGVTYRWQADTADVQVQVKLFEY